MTKKIGILNFQYSDHNYGAVLQAAALEFSIKNLGYEAEHINFIPLLQPQLTNRQKLRRLLVSCKHKLLPPPPNKVIYDKSVFEDFRKKWLTRTTKTFNSMAELHEIDSNYAAIVVGSDQVWRPQYTQNNAMAYFLTFASVTCRRVSYAASFGVDYWASSDDLELTTSVANELKKFDSISVRESSAVKLCEDIFNVKATHVLDPTLLVGKHFFDQIIEQSSHDCPTSDVVYYKLDINDKFVADIEAIGARYNYSTENIYYKNINGELHYNPVAEWLEKLKESKLVVTDSFHCICFSILFGKQFIYYPNDARGMSRLESLLSAVGLMDRICFNTKGFSSNDLANEMIDYCKVHEILDKLRAESMGFLQKSLA